jgi:hypothetical protein
VLIGELQRSCVTVAARLDGRLKQDGSANDMHNRKRMRIAVRIAAIGSYAFFEWAPKIPRP